MARGFVRKRAGYAAQLDREERHVMRSLLEQTLSIVEPPDTGPGHRLTGVAGDAFFDLVTASGMLDSGTDGGPDDRDPALRRLLPDAHTDDKGISAEFRALTEHNVRSTKSARLLTAIGALRAADETRGEELTLRPDDAHAFLAALADVRLVLADRLGVETEEDAQALHTALGLIGDDEEEPDLGEFPDARLSLALSYDFVSWLQETLATALLGSLEH